jgi:uncharacterized protein YegP (UPF0339 family)
MSDLHKAGVIDAAAMHEFDQQCLADQGKPVAKSASGLAFQVLKDAKGEWRWRLIAGNGKRIAGSGEGYRSKVACLAAIELVKQSSSASIAA